MNLLHGRSLDTLGDTDQNRLFEMFLRHRLLNEVSNDTLALLEPNIGLRWREAIRSHTLKSMQLTGILEMIIGELKRRQLGVISIKGPILSQRLYGDIGKRHYSDLDLVVKRDQFLEILEVLEGMGYIMSYPDKELNSQQWDYYFIYKKDVALISRESKLVVELHVEIFRQELISTVEEGFIWDGLVKERIGREEIRCLNLNTSFLYLIYHGGQHLYFRLFWLKDIAVALDSWDLDHNLILKRAKVLGVDRLLGMGLLLSNEIFGTDIPSEYDFYIQSKRSVLLKLKKICIGRIKGPERETGSWKIRRYRFVFLLRPGIRYYKLILKNILHRRYIRRRLGGF